MNTVDKWLEEFREKFRMVRLSITGMKADMQVQTTGSFKGQIFSAVPTSFVEKWFDIIEQKYMDELKSFLAQVRNEEEERIRRETLINVRIWTKGKIVTKDKLRQFILSELKE